MDTDAGYGALIDYLNTRDIEARQRKKHRLPMDRYARSDCDIFLTLCARQWGEPFLAPALSQAIVDAMLWRHRRQWWVLRCYCLMPDHLHFIVRLPEGPPLTLEAGARGAVPEGILDQAGRFKRFTTTQIWWKQGGTGQLWQKSSYDRVIWFDKSARAATEYVLNNPVRKGLVARWEEYPYSGLLDE